MGTRRGRRVVIRLAACAVIGAVVTVGVAWGIAAKRRTYGAATPGLGWFGRVPASWPERPDGRADFGGIGRRWHTRFVGDSYSAQAWSQVVLEYGWPAIAVRIEQREWRTGGSRERTDDSIRLRAFRRFALWPNGLPIVPLPGFAIDTAFYAAVAFTVWSAPGFARRRRRRARGHCPACGYDLSGSKLPECPECGIRREGVAEGTEEVPSASAHE